jgi:hypothetical protein
MAKKKAAPKSKVSKDRPKKAKAELAELIISQEVWDRVVKDLGDTERSERTRDLFAMADGEETVYGVKYCKIKIRSKATVKSTDADDADDRGPYPIKLCDEGGR